MSENTSQTLQARCQDVTDDAEDGCVGYASADDVDAGSTGAPFKSRTLNQTRFEGVGSYPVQLRIEDSMGNVDTCVATVTVKETYHCASDAEVAAGVFVILGLPLILFGLCFWRCRRKRLRRRDEDEEQLPQSLQLPRPSHQYPLPDQPPPEPCFYGSPFLNPYESPLAQRLSKLEEGLQREREREPPLVKDEDIVVIPPEDVLPMEASAPTEEELVRGLGKAS